MIGIEMMCYVILLLKNYAVAGLGVYTIMSVGLHLHMDVLIVAVLYLDIE